MPHRVLHYRWEWRLRSSPEALWPFIADTNRFNRDAGLPAVERVAANAGPDAPAPSRRRTGRS